MRRVNHPNRIEAHVGVLGTAEPRVSHEGLMLIAGIGNVDRGLPPCVGYGCKAWWSIVIAWNPAGSMSIGMWLREVHHAGSCAESGVVFGE